MKGEEGEKKNKEESHIQTQLEKATYNTASRRDGEGRVLIKKM